MNLIETIGAYVRAGLTSAEIAAKLEIEHAIQVTEAWVEKLRGADGFTVVASAETKITDEAKAATGAVEDSVDKLEGE